MERIQRQSAQWRIYAAFVVLLLLVSVLRGPLIPGAGLNWEGAKALYWSFGILGLVGYAYGFRIFSQTFWRAYSLIFAADITIRFMAKIGWVPFARLLGLSEGSRHASLPILIVFGLIAATCVALLRYGGWIKGPDPAPAIIARKPKEPVARIDRPRRRYSLAHCALASIAGAVACTLLLGLYLGSPGVGSAGLGFATFQFIVAFLVLACGGCWLANRLAAVRKDTLGRGVAIGASLGALVAAILAIVVASALVGSFIAPGLSGIWIVASMGAPFGLVNGAIVGGVLILLGRWGTRRDVSRHPTWCP